MAKFPASEYYLVRIFRKLPFPFFTWPFLLTIINLIANYKVILGFERVAGIEYIRFYVGNTIFSIIALLLIVIIYEKNVTGINKWIRENDILGEKSDVITELNKIHKYLFGWYQFLVVVAFVVIRRVLAYFLLQESMIPEVGVRISIATFVFDVIVVFLVLSLFLTSIGVILCLYITGSNGVKATYSFEIRNAYKDLVSLAVVNVVVIGMYLALYGSAVVVWAYQYLHSDNMPPTLAKNGMI